MLPSSWSVTSRSWAAAAPAMRARSSGSSAASVTSTSCRTGRSTTWSCSPPSRVANVPGADFGQPELAVEVTGVVDARHAERHRPESVQSPWSPPLPPRLIAGRSTESTACQSGIGMSTQFRYCTVVAKPSRIDSMATAALTRTEQVYAAHAVRHPRRPPDARRQAPVRRAGRPVRRQHQRHQGRAHRGSSSRDWCRPSRSTVSAWFRCRSATSTTSPRPDASSKVSCCACSIDAGDLEWESAIVAAHHTLERTPMMTRRRSGSLERRVAGRSRRASTTR